MMIELLTQNQNRSGWVDQVPGPISSGYQAQNTAIEASWRGRDDSYLMVMNSTAVGLKASGIIADFGLPFVVKSDVVIAIPSAYGSYFLYLYPRWASGDHSQPPLLREVRTTTSSPLWLPAHNCYAITDGGRQCRVLNWLVTRSSAGLSAIRLNQVGAAQTEWVFFESGRWRCPVAGRYLVLLVSGAGGGGGGGGGGAWCSYGRIVVDTAGRSGYSGGDGNSSALLGYRSNQQSGGRFNKYAGAHGGAGAQSRYDEQGAAGNGGKGGSLYAHLLQLTISAASHAITVGSAGSTGSGGAGGRYKRNSSGNNYDGNAGSSGGGGYGGSGGTGRSSPQGGYGGGYVDAVYGRSPQDGAAGRTGGSDNACSGGGGGAGGVWGWVGPNQSGYVQIKYIGQ